MSMKLHVLTIQYKQFVGFICQIRNVLYLVYQKSMFSALNKSQV